MNRRLSVISTTTVLCMSLAALGAMAIPGTASGAIVRSSATLDTHVLARLRPGIDVEAFVASSAAETIRARAGAASIHPVFSEPLAFREPAERLGLERWLRVELRAGVPADVAGAALATFGSLFDRVELDEAVEVGESGPPLPNDSDFGLQYGVHNTGQTIQGSVGTPDADLNGPEAWALGVGSPIVVGVTDGGVDEHPELAGRVLVGWNMTNSTTSTVDWCGGHGTHVSGIIAATRNNATGIAGIADQSLILPVVVVSSGGCSGSWTWLAGGLVWAVDHGAQVVNMSIHGYDYSSLMEDACTYAHDANVLVVAISGNNHSVVAYPGAYAGAMAIAATDNQDKPASFSNPGPEVDVAAAGKNVYSLNIASGYGYKSGTSMAAPHVTGVAALLLGTAPWLNVDVLQSLIVETSDDVETPGFDNKTGWGRVNAASAMAELLARLAAGDLDANGAIDGADLGILLGAWGGSGPGDLDGDGVVGGGDIGLLLGAWS